MASHQPNSHKVIGTALPLFALRSRAGGLTSPRGGFVDVPPWLDWLAATGQRAWQLLPLSATCLEPGSPDRRAASPYQGYGVGLDPSFLVGSRWERAEPADRRELDEFVAAEKEWLPDYASFVAMSRKFGTDDWAVWPSPALSRHDPTAVRSWAAADAEAIRAVTLEQWRANRAWSEIRRRAEESGIELIGDLSFYLPRQSPLVWAHQRCFDIGADGRLSRVSGVPDSPGSHYGRQVWGHPLYAWSDPTAWPDIEALWCLRLRQSGRLYRDLRLDHAKGFFHYGAMSSGRPELDAFESGPGAPLLKRLADCGRSCGLNLYTEDAGDRVNELRGTLRQLGIPGIRILRFAYNERRQAFEAAYADTKRYPADAFAYTSTHDTEPLLPYVEGLNPAERSGLADRVGIRSDGDPARLAAALRQAAIDSPAGHVIVPLQDWLLSRDRINVPGTERPHDDPNWRYRMPMAAEELPR